MMLGPVQSRSVRVIVNFNSPEKKIKLVKINSSVFERIRFRENDDSSNKATVAAEEISRIFAKKLKEKNPKE